MNTIEKLKSFFNKYHVIKYKKGERIFRPGESISDILFVKSGVFQICSDSKDGRELILAVINAKQFKALVFGTSQNKIFEFSTEALTPVEIVKAPKEDFEKLFRDNPDVTWHMINSHVKLLD